jgi:hypothetical protein
LLTLLLFLLLVPNIPFINPFSNITNLLVFPIIYTLPDAQVRLLLFV